MSTTERAELSEYQRKKERREKMTTEVKGLAQEFKGHMADLNKLALEAKDTIGKGVGALKQTLGMYGEQGHELLSLDAELREALGVSSNSPPLD